MEVTNLLEQGHLMAASTGSYSEMSFTKKKGGEDKVMGESSFAAHNSSRASEMSISKDKGVIKQSAI